ncbi:MAG: carbamoyltransferase [Thiotrichaceae bacterium]|nr:carbamoyltransferase [Thiotrichaceae bacterium]
MNIIGISAYYHDSAAALIRDGNIVAAAQEERFTRKKHDASFPKNALNYCLQTGDIDLQAVDYIVFYDKPLVKFERLLETYLAYAPRGFRSFLQAMPVWLKEKLYLKTVLQKELKSLSNSKIIPKLLFTEHHQSHAASAYFPSPFDKAAVLCLDGVGEWATTSVWLGEGNRLTPQWEIDFPHSLGLLYSAFTYFTGFKVNSGEYKLMGLAPYGEPKYVQTILEHLIDVKPDGTFRLNMDYFNYPVGLTMTNHAFAGLFDGAARQSESAITQREMDIARSIQVVTEDIVLKLARTIRQELDVKNLCLAGGVALNCVANGKLIQAKVFDNIWIQPAAGDAGGALGAALTIWYEYLDNSRTINQNDAMQGSYLGAKFSNAEIKAYLDSINADYTYLPDSELMPQVAEKLAQEKVVGWFQGRMEFGPRALGGRSILGDPRSEKMQSVMNLKIKYRESFRPFAPSILAERVSDYFDMDCASPYMLLVATLKQNYCIPMTTEQQQLFGIKKLNIPRSKLPAITHLDYSARIQTVHQETNPRYHQLLSAFEKLTACPVLVNTSFNVRGEPIVHTPQQAYQCFMRTEMDCLVLENYLLDKSKQTAWRKNEDWQQEFELD